MHEHVLRKMKLTTKQGLRLKPTGKEVGVLELAARNAFYEMKLPQLKLLAAFREVAVPSPMTILEVLGLLIQIELPGLSPQALLGILSLRCLRPEGNTGAEIPEEMRDAMDELDPDTAKELCGGKGDSWVYLFSVVDPVVGQQPQLVWMVF